MIDIGVNLTNSRFDNDRPEVLQRAQDAGVRHCIVTGTSEQESEQAIYLCKRWLEEFPGMLSATVGVHPHHASDFSRTTNANLENLIREHSNVVVAVGETGLDFNRDFSPRPEQEKAFEAQLELAANTDLPVFLHERDAYQRQYPILKSVRDDIKAGVIHCFTGTRKHLYGYLDLDLYIGITGWVCDPKRGLELRQLISDIPLERLMIETDAPYLLPKTLDTKPKNGRNEPCYLPVVLETIAELRDIPPDELAAVITQNTIQFFDLKGDSPTQPAPSSA